MRIAESMVRLSNPQSAIHNPKWLFSGPSAAWRRIQRTGVDGSWNDLQRGAMSRPLQALALIAVLGTPLAAQTKPADLLQAAHEQITANHLDSADALFRVVIDTATPATNAERATALLWRGIIAFTRGSDSLTHVAFRDAFAWSPSLKANGLAPISQHLQDIFDQEQRAAPQMFVHVANMNPAPYRVGGPPLRYPPALLRRHLHGQVRLSVVLDTLGHIEPGSVQVYDAPDSALIGPLRDMALASQYAGGRADGKPVRAMIDMILDLHPPPPPTATLLAGQARDALRAQHADSALALLADAMDTATHATEGEQMYVLIVRSMARAADKRDSAARADLDSAFALKRDLTAKQVDLAPFLLRLADSVRLARRGVAPSRGPSMGAPALVGTADVAPTLLTHPRIAYPLEMQRLSVAGTVVVEASVDATGHVTAAKVVESPNPGLDVEALRVVRGSLYRAARRSGQAAAVTIRQSITFAAY